MNILEQQQLKVKKRRNLNVNSFKNNKSTQKFNQKFIQRVKSSLQQAQSIYTPSIKNVNNNFKGKIRKLKTQLSVQIKNDSNSDYEDDQNLFSYNKHSNLNNDNNIKGIKFNSNSKRKLQFNYDIKSKNTIENYIDKDIFKKKRRKLHLLKTQQSNKKLQIQEKDIINFKLKHKHNVNSQNHHNKSLNSSSKSFEKDTLRIHQVKYVKSSQRYATLQSQLLLQQQQKYANQDKQYKQDKRRRVRNKQIHSSLYQKYQDSNNNKQLYDENLKQHKNKSIIKSLDLMPLPFVKKQTQLFINDVKKIKQELLFSKINIKIFQKEFSLKSRMRQSSCKIIYKLHKNLIKRHLQQSFKIIIQKSNFSIIKYEQ